LASPAEARMMTIALLATLLAIGHAAADTTRLPPDDRVEAMAPGSMERAVRQAAGRVARSAAATAGDSQCAAVTRLKRSSSAVILLTDGALRRGSLASADESAIWIAVSSDPRLPAVCIGRERVAEVTAMIAAGSPAQAAVGAVVGRIRGRPGVRSPGAIPV